MAKSLDDVLKYDPLADAEKVTGTSYKKDMATLALGMMLSQSHSGEKRRMLEERDDTTFSNSLDRYVRIVESEGFSQILKLDFQSSSSGKQESLFVFYHYRDGILLKFDTYYNEHVNGGKFYYNIKPYDRGTFWKYISSGGFTKVDEEYVWVGDHDCREALRHHIASLRKHGDFVKEWVSQPFLWLLHHGDTKERGYDYKAITAERIAMLPLEVQRAIAGKKE